MNIAVIIVTFNGAKYISKCLSSIFKCDQDATVIVVDNASSDNTLSLIEQFSCDVIELKVNVGFGAANNIGITHALKNPEVSHLFLLNQDAYLEEDLFYHLKNIPVEKRNSLIACTQVTSDGVALDKQSEKFYLDYASCPGFLNDCYFGRLKDFYEIRFMNAAAWILPSRIVYRIGGFSPTFFHYGEDSNLIDRLRFHGESLHLSTKCVVRHDRDDRQKSNYDKDVFKEALASIVRFSDPSNESDWIPFVLKKSISIILGRGKSVKWKRQLIRELASFNWTEIQKNRELSRSPDVDCFL